MIDLRLRETKHDCAVMIDRDGTINLDLGYTHRIEDLKFLENSISGLKLLAPMPIHIIIVTNQSGIALGLYEQARMSEFHREMVRRIEQLGGRIDAVYFSPYFDLNSLPPSSQLHYSSKPNPGMLEEAASDFSVNLYKSWMIGDRITDVVAGKSAGTQTILIGDNGGPLDDIDDENRHQFMVSNLFEAAQHIAMSF
mgnify:CR=1 FL=1